MAGTGIQVGRELVDGERQADYGEPVANMERIAEMWSGILGHRVTGAEVALCMAGLKLTREENRHKADNLADLAGYLHIAQLARGALPVLSDGGDEPVWRKYLTD